MKQAYDLIVFDWDGTLIDSIGWIVDCLRHAAAVCGLPDPSDSAARSVIGLSLGAAMQSLFDGISPSEQTALVQAYQRHYITQAIGPDDLFEGVIDMLTDLRAQGYRLAVATGKGRNGLQRALHGTRTDALFCTTRCADETVSKPHPRMLLEIMGEIGAPAQRTLMVGDSVHDLQMAGNAGVAAVAVTCGANSRDELLAHKPMHCLTNTVQLMELLRS